MPAIAPPESELPPLISVIVTFDPPATGGTYGTLLVTVTAPLENDVPNAPGDAGFFPDFVVVALSYHN